MTTSATTSCDDRYFDGEGDMTEYETILVEQRGRVGWITLNRPEALHA